MPQQRPLPYAERQAQVRAFQQLMSAGRQRGAGLIGNLLRTLPWPGRWTAPVQASVGGALDFLTKAILPSMTHSAGNVLQAAGLRPEVITGGAGRLGSDLLTSFLRSQAAEQGVMPSEEELAPRGLAAGAELARAFAPTDAPGGGPGTRTVNLLHGLAGALGPPVAAGAAVAGAPLVTAGALAASLWPILTGAVKPAYQEALQAAGQAAGDPVTGAVRAPGDLNLDQQVDVGLSTIWKSVRNLSPWSELLTVSDPTKPLEPREFGKEAISALAKTAILAGVAGGAPKGSMRHATIEANTRIYRLADLEAATERVAADVSKAREAAAEARAAKLAAEGPPGPAPAAGAPPPGAAAGRPAPMYEGPFDYTPAEIATMEQFPAMPQATVKKLMDHARASPVFRKIAERLAREDLTPDGRLTRTVAETIREAGGIDPDVIGMIMNNWDMPIERAADVLAQHFIHTRSRAGGTLGVNAQMITEMSVEAAAGLPDALAVLKAFEVGSKNTSGARAPAGMYAKINSWVLRPAETARRTGVVIQPATFQRIVTSQSGNSLMLTMEAAIADSMIHMAEVRAGVSPTNAYYETIAHVAAAVARMRPSQRTMMNEIMAQIPLERQRFLNVNSAEITHLMSTRDAAASVTDMLVNSGVPTNWVQRAANAWGTVITTPLRLMEREFRLFMGGARLRANMKRLGIDGPEAILAELKKPTELTPETGARTPRAMAIDAAIHDSMAYGLKGTMAYTPHGGLSGAILKAYSAHPVLSALGPMFPRLVINRYLWITERSPFGMLDLVDPKFRAKLANVRNPTEARAAAEQLAKATSGTFWLAGAITMDTEPQWTGPRWYHVPTNAIPGWQRIPGIKEDPQHQGYLDIRGYDPLSFYKFIGRAVRTMSEGRDPLTEFTAPEITDVTIGARRAEELPLGMVFDALRAAINPDPKVFERVWKTPAGQYLASWAVPGRAVQDVMGAFWPEPAAETARTSTQPSGDPRALRATQEIRAALRPLTGAAQERDVETRELLGPAMANIPFVERNLPPRIDPFTGDPRTSPHPGLRQALGLTIEYPTELEEVVRSTPGAQVGDLFGQGLNPAETNFMHRTIGHALNRTIDPKTGLSAGAILARQMAQITDPAERLKELQAVFQPLREATRTDLEKEQPLALFDRMLSAVPSGSRDAVRQTLTQMFRNMGINYADIQSGKVTTLPPAQR